MNRKEAKKLEFLPVPEGLKIKYQHFYQSTDGRPVRKIEDLDGDPCWVFCDEREGRLRYDGTRVLDSTMAWLENPKGETVAEGHSSCNPKDTPNKKLGRCIAHNRCIKDWLKKRAEENPLDARLRYLRANCKRPWSTLRAHLGLTDPAPAEISNQERGDLAFGVTPVH